MNPINPTNPINKGIESILPLTEEQRPALDSEMGNCLVSAGAGSGKTRVLIARFAELVFTGKARVKEVLAITLTEKAASEMKYRLIDVFEKAGREDLRREVEEAYVATMHSFASRLLKEYALEIGVDPETGKVDLDRMTTGISASTRGVILKVRNIIFALCEEKEGAISVDEDLKPKVFDKGITEIKLEEAIDKLKRAGDIFEPKKGWLQKI